MYGNRFDFGKHRGRAVEDVPTGYLKWVLRDCECVNPWLRQAVADELERREEDSDGKASQAGPSRPLPAVELRQLVDGWYRGLTLKWHPDRGGSVEGMQAVNEAHERLVEMLEQVK